MREVALAHQRMLLDALERGDSDMARSIATVQVEERRRWIEHLLNAPRQPRPTVDEMWPSRSAHLTEM